MILMRPVPRCGVIDLGPFIKPGFGSLLDFVMRMKGRGEMAHLGASPYPG